MLFMFKGSSTFGAKPAPAFGSQTPATGGLFGAAGTGGLFGQTQTTSTFGQSSNLSKRIYLIFSFINMYLKGMQF